MEIAPRLKTIRGVRYIGMVFGIVGSQLFSNAKPLAAEMVGSAFKITHTNHRTEHTRQLGCKGAILIECIFAELRACSIAPAASQSSPLSVVPRLCLVSNAAERQAGRISSKSSLTKVIIYFSVSLRAVVCPHQDRIIGEGEPAQHSKEILMRRFF